MNASGGTYMRAEPALVKDLVWAGFDMVSRANNHTGDYGVLGMNLTTKYVAEAGLVQAGVGQSLAEAREAKFLETPKGRVALISVASTFPDHSRAGRTRGDMPARPGLNPLRFDTITTVTPERLATLREMAAEINGRPAPDGRRADVADVLRPPLHSRRHTGRAHGAQSRKISTNCRRRPQRRRPRRLHHRDHSRARGRARSLVPADFLVTFARAMVDAGADMFVGHGPHVLRGVEIYKGKPILYSLGDFIFQNETLLRLPSENYESVRPRRRPARQRLQRRALQLRQERLPCRSDDLGSRRRRPEVPRQAAHRARAASDHAGIRSVAQRAWPAAVCRRRARTEDPRRHHQAVGHDGNENRGSRRRRVRRCAAPDVKSIGLEGRVRRVRLVALFSFQPAPPAPPAPPAFLRKAPDERSDSLRPRRRRVRRGRCRTCGSANAAGATCSAPPRINCPEANCPVDQVRADGNAVEPKTGRKFFLDYPCDLKPGEEVVFVLSLHGAGSIGNWQRHYFPIVDLKDKYRLVVATPTAATSEPTRRWVAEADDVFPAERGRSGVRRSSAARTSARSGWRATARAASPRAGSCAPITSRPASTAG